MNSPQNNELTKPIHKKFINNKGYSLLELVVVLFLLAIFGAVSFMLVGAASNSYSSLISKNRNNSELRIASSYINTKLVQNNSLDAINVIKNPFGADKAIVIKENISGNEYYLWICTSKGFLKEFMFKKNEKPDSSLGLDIAKINTLDASLDKKTGLLKYSVKSDNKEYGTDISLVTGGSNE